MIFIQNRGTVFRRGGLRGGRSGGGGQRRDNSRFPNRQSTNSRESEPVQPTAKDAPASSKASKDMTGQNSSTDKSSSKVEPVGVHLHITPSIFNEMRNRALGDKVFIMIPKYAKTVLDVKFHVALMVGINQQQVTFFINGFRIPDTEDVDAFACISKDALVQ